MAQINFDATQYAPNVGFELLPEGWFAGKITKSELKPTKDGAGSYLQLSVNCIYGKYAGMTLIERLNINNPNDTAQRIAYGQLSAICHAVGIMQVQDSSQLHDIPFKFKTKVIPAVIDEDTGEQIYGAKNEISVYRSADEQVVLWDDEQHPISAQQITAPATTQKAEIATQQTASNVDTGLAKQPWQNNAVQSTQTATQTTAQATTETTQAPAESAGTSVPPWKRGK